MQAIMMIINSSELYLKNLQPQNNESDYKALKGALQDIADTKSNFDSNKFSNAIQVIISLAEKSDHHYSAAFLSFCYSKRRRSLSQDHRVVWH